MTDDTSAAAPTYTCHIALDGNGVVVGKVRSNCPQPGMVDVDDATYAAAVVGGSQYINGALQPYTPPPAPVSPPTVTGNQWAFALSDLGLSSAWQVGVAKSKAKDQVRVDLIARDTPLLAADPLLARVAANAGTADGTAAGAPLIDVPTVFTRAQAMPL